MSDDDLTPAGWPRPIVNGYPIPWVSPAHMLATMDKPRLAEAATGRICAVCGLAHAESDQAYIVVSGPAPPFTAETLAQAMDNAVMHMHCARLALKLCPELLKMIRERRLLLLKVDVAAVECDEVPIEELDSDGEGVKHRTCVPIANCEVVGTASPEDQPPRLVLSNAPETT